MKVKNLEWIEFKRVVMEVLSVLQEDSEQIAIPDDEKNLAIIVYGETISPVFIKGKDFLRIEYDLSLSQSKLRTLAFSTFKDCTRIEMTLKNGHEGTHIDGSLR